MIRITFADGSHEDRDDASPCLCGMFDPPSRHPSEERWYLYCPGDRQPLSFCGISVWSLATVRGWTASVWRITSVKGEPLAGEWAECHVESFEEQIARLTAERDAVLERLEEAVSVLQADTSADVEAVTTNGPIARVFSRSCLQALGTAKNFTSFKIMGGYPGEAEVLAIVTIRRPGGNTPEEVYHEVCEARDAETARADAAEKRLTDLRAWAENIATGQSDSPEGRRVAGDFRAVVYRIDVEDV